jgi:hypothetical protein
MPVFKHYAGTFYHLKESREDRSIAFSARYDRFLNDLSVEQVREWSNMVFDQMKKKLNLHDLGKVYFHAGRRYRQYLIPMLEQMDIKCEVPLENLGIGRQLAWYKENFQRRSNSAGPRCLVKVLSRDRSR